MMNDERKDAGKRLGDTNTYFAQRTCTEIKEDQTGEKSEGSSLPLKNFGKAAAYMLIGEPGAGKTTAFKREAACSDGLYITARNFLSYDDKPEWHNKTLYIDGLDETRAGLMDGRTPLDQIRAKLYQLGCPWFRLSCRWSYWLGSNDRDHLKEVSSDGKIVVLRLDSLSKNDIKDILHKNFNIEDTDEFLSKAKNRGIYSLLSNPQSLEMLAEAVSAGKWPETRKETFELACRTLVAEFNDEHRSANSSRASIPRLLNAAGRLCAVQLLSGGAGYTLPEKGSGDNNNYPALDQISGDDEEALRDVLGTRLFEGSFEGRVSPVHRQIAEFLAARYVAGLIDGGLLPLKRLLALIAGYDGMVISELWVFVAWLAVHSKTSRFMISQINPSGMIYMGDAQEYSTDEKSSILENLRRESDWNPWCSGSIRRTSGIGKIVAPELEETFRDILSNSNRSRAYQSYILMILGILEDGQVLPGLSSLIEKMVRDDTCYPSIKSAALDVLIKQNKEGCFNICVFEDLLKDVSSGAILDPEDELLGSLLGVLYPERLTVLEVLRYLRKPKNTSVFGKYSQFWVEQVPKNSTNVQLGQFLDEIAAQFDQFRPFFAGEIGVITLLHQFPIALLERFLNTLKEEVSSERLFNWLAIASTPELRTPEWRVAGISSWMIGKQELLKKLINLGVESCSKSGNFRNCISLVERCLFGVRPWDFAPWCLDQAIATENKNSALYYMSQVAEYVVNRGQNNARLSREAVQERIAGNTDLLTFFERRVSELEDPAFQETCVEYDEPLQDTQDQVAWQQTIESQEVDLLQNVGNPSLLHELAMVYLGNNENIYGNTPRERLHNLIGSKRQLINVVLEGLRGSIDRDDLPACSDVIRLAGRNRTHHLVFPFMAGLEEMTRKGQFEAASLNESQIALAVTIHYSLSREMLYPDLTARPELSRPQWLKVFLTSSPNVVADTLIECIRLKLHNEKVHITELYELAFSDDHKDVARLATLPLLEDFPLGSTKTQLEALSWLLKAGLLSCDWTQLIKLVEKKILCSDMESAQRIYWLGTGLIVAPDQYREKMEAYVKSNESQVSRLVDFLCAGRFPHNLMQNLEVQDLKLLIDLIASSVENESIREDAWRVNLNLIEKLSSIPSRAATEVLEGLSSNASLSLWSPAISGGKHRQSNQHRKVEFSHYDVQKVIETLDNHSPANVADLAALTLHLLENIAEQIPKNRTSDWKQYWNVDSHNIPLKPKPENACRDALLSDLNYRFTQLGIDGQPEGRYVNEKRSDIRVSYASFNVPIEIKVSSNPKLWSAIRTQLINDYSQDPGADGYGIYLVFWFGTEKCKSPPGDAAKPENANDLLEGLTKTLSANETLKIAVCVIDVSK